MTAPSQAVERYTIEPHGEAGNFALYFGRDSGRHGMRLLNLNDGDSRMDAHIALIERALNRYDALTARVRELEAALVVAVPRMAHRIGCYRGRPTEEWAQHGSASFDGCECEIKQARAALANFPKESA